jgi:hypothetical protein
MIFSGSTKFSPQDFGTGYTTFDGIDFWYQGTTQFDNKFSIMVRPGLAAATSRSWL